MANSLPVVVEAAAAPHLVTRRMRQLVARLSAFGLDESEIAFVLEVEPKVLRSSYADELRNGTALMVAKVGNSMYKQARKGDTNAGRFLLQARGRWVVPTKVELTGKDGGPVELKFKQELQARILGHMRALQAKGPTTPAKPEQGEAVTPKRQQRRRGPGPEAGGKTPPAGVH